MRAPHLLMLAVALFVSGTVGKTQATTEIRYLSGTGKDDAVLWDFFCTAGRQSGVWTKIRVPSCWETEGFGEYQYGGDRQRETNQFPVEQGKYRLNFDVPDGWKNRVVRLVFDGAMTDTEVWVNGKSAGPIHQGAFYRFKYDITNLIRFGVPNLLEVTVSKESSNVSVNRAERMGDYWNFGGIFRPVFLEALPARFIDCTAIDARADGSFSIDIHLGGAYPTVSRLTAQIIDAGGRTIGQPFSAQLDRQQNQIKLDTKVVHPKLWTAETPYLYSVRITLSGGTEPPHTITERFGFRTFEVKPGDGFYLNGQRILLKGANRHSFWPETGRTLSKQISYDDVRLLKEMNMNAVRMSHYPPDEHFLAACDELGLYVLDELAGWQKSYDTPSGQRLVGELVHRDVNHPSILFWDNGNEGGWNRELDDEFARWDPQKRFVLHPWENFRGINTDHYEKYDSHTKLSAGPDIYMPTEFLHGLYDGGIGAGMWDYWELIRTSKVGGGGFFWALVDECVVRTDQKGRLDCAGNRGPDGIVGPHREREGSFYTVREIWSPIEVEPEKLSSGFSGVLKVENRFDFTNLRECFFEWQLGRFPAPDTVKSGHSVIASGRAISPKVQPHESGELRIKLPANWREGDVLYVTVKDPRRRELWTTSWLLQEKIAPRVTKAANSGQRLETRETEKALEVESGAVRLVFSKTSGELIEVSNRGRLVSFGSGPRFLAFRRQDRKYADLTRASSLTQFAWRREEEEIVVETRYEGALNLVNWRIARNGSARLDYQYSFDGVVDMIGVQFRTPERSIERVRWLGRGPYRVWQNRLQGTRLDVWENSYNDSTPGESWIYPEFKGYFRDWQWITLHTANGFFEIENGSGNSFLGLFRPKDGINGLLDLPEIGIAFLDVIPAMRNKFHTSEEIGPQSKPKPVSGSVHRTIYFRFGR